MRRWMRSPAGTPGILQLDGRHDAAFAQIEFLGKVRTGAQRVCGGRRSIIVGTGDQRSVARDDVARRALGGDRAELIRDTAFRKVGQALVCRECRQRNKPLYQGDGARGAHEPVRRPPRRRRSEAGVSPSPGMDQLHRASFRRGAQLRALGFFFEDSTSSASPRLTHRSIERDAIVPIVATPPRTRRKTATE